MNIAPQADMPSDPVASEGVVAAGAYVEAGGSPISPSRKPRAGAASRATWSGSGCYEPDMALLHAACSSSSSCTISPSRTRATPISGRRSSNMATACSSWRARRSSSTAASRSAKPICSSARDIMVSVRHGASTSYAAVRERCEAARGRWPAARITSSTPSSTSSSTTTSPVLETIQEEVEEIEEQRARKRDDAGRDRAALYAAARSAAPAQRGRATGRGLPPARARRICR